MHTMLSTTHLSTHAMYCCYYDCTHAHHVVHYTLINTCYVLLLLWLYPCTPCCPQHTYQHMLCTVAIMTVPMHTMLSTTHLSTHAMYCCYYDCTHAHHVVHYTLINTCYVLLLLWLYPCTPCCPLHTYQHMLCTVAIMTVLMYTMLSTTHLSTHAMYGCYYDCTHVHHVVHCTLINTCYVLLLLWLYPCTPCCPLHTYQHMLCTVAIMTVPMHTMLSTTHLSTHAMYCCYYDCTHAHHVVHCTLINTCYVLLLLWLYPCTPCCPLHTYQHMLCTVAIMTVPMHTMLSTAHLSTHAKYCCYYDCTHAHHVVHYTLINTCYVLLLLWLYPCTPCCPLHTYQHMLCTVAIMTVPMHTMLSTAHLSTHAMYCCYYDCSHAHHVVHYTLINTCYVLLLLWLYPCTPCCPLHTYQHMLCTVAIMTVPMHTMLSTTHLSTHAMYCCYYDCTHVHHVVHCTLINTCYVLLLLWLYPCTPCCPLHTYQHMLCTVAIMTVPMHTMLSTAHLSTHAMYCCYYDCTHAHHVVHYTLINTCYVLLLLWLYPCTPCCPLHTYQHMLCTVAIMTVLMYTMLSTTHLSTHAMYGCYYDCTHVHHVVHCTLINTCYVLLLLWLYPCTPCCPLHTYQHMLCTVAIMTVPMHTMLSTTHLSTHAMYCCYYDCTHAHHVVHCTLINTCYVLLLLWLYPCTPCCPLHTYQHMLCTVAIMTVPMHTMLSTAHLSTHAKYCCYYDCTHAHHVVHYTLINTCYVLLLLWLYPCTPCCPLHTYQHMLCTVAIMTVPMHTMLSTAHLSTHAMYCCYYDCSHAHHVVHYTLINTCYVLLLLWLYPCTPCCPLHTYQHMLWTVAIMTVPMHTMLSTTHLSTHAMYGCYYDCTHVHHVVHCTLINTCYVLLLLWLYPCTPCCPLHTYQHMLCTVAIMTVPMHTMLSTTHLSTHAMYCCYYDCTHEHHVVHCTLINTCYVLLLLWLYPCTPCCPQHTYQHMLCTVAIMTVPMHTMLSTAHLSTHAMYCCYYDCTHAHHVVHCTLINTCYVLLLLWLFPCTPCCPLHTYQHMLWTVAIMTVPMHTMLSTTHLSTHAMYCCYYDCTHAHHVVHYTLINTCYVLLLLWLYPCTPCCPLHTYQHMLWTVAIMTVPMYTMLSTTHLSTHAMYGCYYDCTHVHHVVHCTLINTCYVWLLLWLYPCTPCCPLHTYQHMLCTVAIMTVPMYTMLSTTHLSTHAMYCCYYDCTHAHHVVHYTLINTCYVLLLLWLYPCTPCCPLHTYQHMLCTVAIMTVPMYTMLSTTHLSTHAMDCCYYDCTHAHHVVHYTLINTCYVLLLLWLYPCTPCCPLHTYQHMLCTVAIMTVPMYTMLSTTHLSTHAMYCCYYDCTHAHHVVHCTLINTCYVLLLLWLYPCTPCCPLHTYQHMLCTVAIMTVPMHTMLSTTHLSTHAMYCCYYDCTHAHHVVHYTLINTCYVLLLLWLYPCTPCCPLHK